MIPSGLLAQAGQAPPERVPTPDVELTGIGPEAALVAASLVILTMVALSHRWPRLRDAGVALGVSVVGLGAAAVFVAAGWSDVTTYGAFETLEGMVAVDGFSLFLKAVVLAATFVGLLVAHGYLRRERLDAPSHHALILLSASGMAMMASANDLIVVFLALEILSISLYVLAAFHRFKAESQEAGMKYFVLGSFSSAVLLYGIAFVYGGTGTTSLTGIGRYLAEQSLVDNAGLLAGLVLLLVGLAFKIAAVPFHMWTPDVYEGAPTPVTGFMAAGAKVAGFAALLRILGTGLESYRLDWEPLIWVLAVATMVAGSVLAIVQTNVKRLLAYSSISHAGFILIGVQAGTDDGVSSALSYLLAYSFIVLGSFAVVTAAAHHGDAGHELEDYRGFGSRAPVLAGLLTLFMLAQAGIPLTSGFVAKLAVFRAAVNDEQYALAIIGVLASVVAVFVYLRLLVVSYMGSGGDEQHGVDESDGVEGEPAGAPAGAVGLAAPPRVDRAAGLGLGLAAAFTLWMGVTPNVFLDLAERATLLF